MSPPMIEQTKNLVRKLFDGVMDKGGRPYADHCIRVMELLPEGLSEDAYHAALLHDVLEDTVLRAFDLKALGYSDRTINLVRALSRPDGSVYMDWVRWIADSGDRELIAIKLADNADNSDPERIAQLPPEQRDIAKRYELARRILESPAPQTETGEME